MPVEATDVAQPFDDAPTDATIPEVEPDTCQDSVPDSCEDSVPDKPKRGRPAGSKDKQPRQRCVSAVLPRVVTRRSATVRTSAKRVQIESASEASESAEESPRTARHRQFVEFRQHKQDVHQNNVDRYVRLFDRMLA